MMTMTTTELCNALGVSRSWINKYLRPLGVRGTDKQHPSLRWVYYDESDIVDYINTHAIFDRKTTWFKLSDYMDDIELKKQMLFIREIENEQAQQKAYWDLLGKILPPDTAIFTLPNLSARNRGGYEWHRIKSRIVQLGDLHTMTDLQGKQSAELVYRDAFLRGWIRVRVHGHTWFVITDQPASGDLAVLAPASDD